ncbi:NAD(P)/FAD-dependent oxidoreductase [Aureivirga sp. CE67]|uniref:NAD(P)/FAD-dependent oxidoreductase n=1 Tax=Aureivirga sp. CE67 TaxID=1788983 RepID=UPI0018CB6A9C|nr:FAD-binding oxidoreductase [Aureivirga sp. CE67]
MKVDYIIVGLGLAGLAFAEQLREHGKTFVVFEDNSQTSSNVAGGMYNPVILKRFTPVWNAVSQLDIAMPFYKKLEEKFNSQYDYPVAIQRSFKSIEEQNNWFATCDHPALSEFMIPKVFPNDNEAVNAPFGFGKLQHTGRVYTKKLLNDYKSYLKESDSIREESFDYEKLVFTDEKVKYNDIIASKVVFCEGFGLKQNPFFNYLPMQEAKGELITIKALDLNIDYLLKSAVFVLPLGDDLYKVGATFNWKDKTLEPSEEGRKELVEKLETVINVPFEIIDQTAGIRPTVKDRRPLVGMHPQYKALAVLNGLGTRGVMIAPTAAKMLFELLEENKEIDQEYSIERFEK